MEFDAVDVFDFDDDGKITRLSSWYDSHAVRRRLRELREVAERRLRGYLTAGITSCPKRRMHSSSSSWLGPWASRRDMIR